LKTTVIFLIVAAIAVGFSLLSKRLSAQKPGRAAVPKKNPYLGLREMAFKQSRASLHLPAGAEPTEPWGAIMEWGTGGGTMTLVGFADGSASIYLSSGGGMIGGQAQKSVNEGARKMVAVAAKVQPHMIATSTFPLPKQGRSSSMFSRMSASFPAEARRTNLAHTATCFPISATPRRT